MKPGGRRARPSFDPQSSGIAANQLIMTDCMLRCGDSLGDDLLYAADVQRFRRLAAPSINRHLDSWILRRDGFMEGAPASDPCTHCGGTGREKREPRWVPGFWINEDGTPLVGGEVPSKEAWMGMEGAVFEILHLDGIYWYKDKDRSKTRDVFLNMQRRMEGDEEE